MQAQWRNLEASDDGDVVAAEKKCSVICCFAPKRTKKPSDASRLVHTMDWAASGHESATDQEQVALLEGHAQATGKKAAMTGVVCLALIAWVSAVILGASLLHHEEARAPLEPYVSASEQFAADVARGECNYAVPKGNGTCFCQLAGNRHCSDDRTTCACSSGCEGDVLESSRTVTFANLGDVGQCEESTALLTVPKSYFEHIDFLLQWCPTVARSLLIELMENGFNNYQDQVAAGPVKQCVHAAKTVTVPWLHVHTFCSEGFMEGLEATGHNGWCSTLENASEVPGMVDELIAWALDGDPPRNATNFTTCRSIGCGQDAPRPLCSCAKDCLEGENGTCCEDFSEVCEL